MERGKAKEVPHLPPPQFRPVSIELYRHKVVSNVKTAVMTFANPISRCMTSHDDGAIPSRCRALQRVVPGGAALPKTFQDECTGERQQRI